MLDDFHDDDEFDKGGEFLDEFRQRLNSQPIENLEERKNDINRSQHIFLGTILGIGLAGVVSWFILSPDYAQTENTEIPVVRRPQHAIKVQPVEPGGMEILNQDKTVYDIVEKKDSNEVKVENLLPPPEEPKLPVIEATIDNLNAESDVIKEAEKIIAAEETVKKEIKIEIKNEPVSAPVQTAEHPQTKPLATPQPEPTPAKPTAPQKPLSTAAAPVGSWQIQLISSPNKSAMEKAWQDLSKKYPQLQGISHEIESADLGSKGTFYRLKAGAFKDRTEADKLCNSIKSAGGSCLVKKK